MKKQLFIAGLAALALSACSAGGAGANEATSSAMPTPETSTITVEIHDTVPLAVYSNADYVKCEAVHSSLPQISISDGAGKVIAVGEGPLIGGTWSYDGCTVPVVLSDVPAADIYIVTVAGENGTTGRKQAKRVGSAQTVRVEL